MKLKYSFEPDASLVAIKSECLILSLTNVIKEVRFSSTVTRRTLATVFSYSLFLIMYIRSYPFIIWESPIKFLWNNLLTKFSASIGSVIDKVTTLMPDFPGLVVLIGDSSSSAFSGSIYFLSFYAFYLAKLS
jgi:hypothetical protein